ncbi:MAG: hypothetical protein DI598_03015 [Pseudopedobacter saltans]|uniref:Uncharacterized protein n=1 Tax=Pseudopedobacter saltans TaxID=151895 RepID=A0A2W5F671_9SPHI|nr:MAG: hypothetical protein DI598_03015 [Pseudopedobacter saltans]
MKKYFVVFATMMWSSGLFAQQASSNTFLDASFWKNNPDITAIQAEIAKGNSPSELNRMAFDPTVMAINSGASLDVIKYLLEQKGNDLNKLTHDARTYIYWAGMKGNLPLVQYLIGKGANLNMEDSHGATPLSFSTNSENSLAVVKALVDGGADLKHSYQDGANLLLMAIGGDSDLKLTDYLVSKGLSLQSTDKNGATAFDYAARAGNLQVLKQLRDRKVKFSNSALLMASEGTRRGSATLEVFQYLVELGIKPNATDAEGKNVLHNLLRRPGQTTIVNYFLEKGVSVNQADKEGNTPFMLACEYNKDLTTIEKLVSLVDNINKKNNAGATALALAIKGNSADVVSLLIGKGADVQTKDNKGNNLAYYLVESFGRGGRGPGGPGGNPNGEPVKDEFAEKMQILKAKGVAFNAKQEDGNSLIYIAAAKESIPLMKKLQGLDIDVNAKNAEGMTALHKAALLAKDDNVLKYLLSIGADKNLKDEMDETAYDLAKENAFLSKKNISIEFLK